MTREKRLALCKRRALKYLPSDPRSAIVSMFNGMQYPETEDCIDRATSMLFEDTFDSVEQDAAKIRQWIEDF